MERDLGVASASKSDWALSDSTLWAILWAHFYLCIDVFLYGIILPIAGVHLAGYFTATLALQPFPEIVLVIILIFALIYGVIYSNTERLFWKHLFRQETAYLRILQIREVINTGLILLNVYNLYHTMLHISSNSSSTGLKQEYLGEGTDYVVLKALQDIGVPVSNSWLDSYVSVKQNDEGRADKRIINWLQTFPGLASDSDKELILAAQLLLAFASLTATIVKLLYFAVLNTYLRAENIFLALQSESDDDASLGENSEENLPNCTIPDTRKFLTESRY